MGGVVAANGSYPEVELAELEVVRTRVTDPKYHTAGVRDSPVTYVVSENSRRMTLRLAKRPASGLRTG